MRTAAAVAPRRRRHRRAAAPAPPPPAAAVDSARDPARVDRHRRRRDRRRRRRVVRLAADAAPARQASRRRLRRRPCRRPGRRRQLRPPRRQAAAPADGPGTRRDLRGRPRRSERSALQRRQVAAAGRSARRREEPGRREGARPAASTPKSLAKNYDLLQDKLLSKSGNFITTVVRESEPRVGKDGLMSMTTEAVVNVKALQKSLNQMSRDERIEIIRASGDPKVSVQVAVARRRAAGRAAAAVAGRREHPEGAHQVVRLPHVVRRRSPTATGRRLRRARRGEDQASCRSASRPRACR